MIKVVEAIVLHSIPHKDSSRIVYVLSEEDEIISLYVSGFGKKRSSKAAVFYPGNHLELELVSNSRSSLFKVSQAGIVRPWLSVQSNFLKSTVLTFLLETIMVYFKAGRPAGTLYSSLLNTVEVLEDEDVDFVNLPMMFLLKESEILGLKPNSASGYFNIKEGVFEKTQHYQFGLGLKESQSLAYLLLEKPSDQIKFNMGNNERRNLIKAYLDFLDYHVESSAKVLSMDVLSTVLND